ncbi:MAG: hypothetical protein LKF49_09525, partial [Bifidobacterium tibiigranuli]|uniref:hypothetical protein n=1 Tax=Bifidobacterium tibiigranuli TaxID=2172043 RepID=UPI002355E678
GNHAAAPRKPPPSQQRKTSTATPGNTGNPTPITTTTTNEFNKRKNYLMNTPRQLSDGTCTWCKHDIRSLGSFFVH